MITNRATVQSPFGAVILLWKSIHREPMVARVVIPRPNCSAGMIVSEISPESSESSCLEIDALCMDIEAFLNGEAIEFSLDILDMGQCTPFQKLVLPVEHTTPRGCVCTYRNIAEKLGTPNAARAIGNALARNPFPIIIPCHRAIKSDGTLGGFQGGIAMKRKLLENEGVKLDHKNRITVDIN